MKLYIPLIIGLFLLSQNAAAQKRVLLLDRKMKQPILYTDSVTTDQVFRSYIPIETPDLDTLYANFQFLAEMLEKRQRSKMEYFELRSGSNKFSITRIPFAYGDRYNIILQAVVDDITAEHTFSNGKKQNSDVALEIRQFMKYIEASISNFRAPLEIHPKIYSIKIIRD